MENLRAYFFSPPQTPFARNPYVKYGFLLFGFALVAAQIGMLIYFRATLSGRSLFHIYGGFIIPIGLILQHLSRCFYFGPRFTFPFRLFSLIFGLVGCGVIFFEILKYP